MRKFFFIISTLVAKVASGQQPEIGAWFRLQVPVTFNAGWQWHHDAGYRTIGGTSSAYQYLYRTGARYFFNKEWSVAAGTAFFFTRNSYQTTDQEFGKEFRIWQELNFDKPISNSFSVQNRIRTEERWFAGVHTREAYSAFRFRHRLSGSQKISDKWSIQLADEYMWQLISNKFSFNQNRLMAAAICTVSTTIQLQGGYM